MARYLDDNPNGSLRDIAGITNERGNVVGLMPHPEHAVEELTGAGHRRARLLHLARASAFCMNPLTLFRRVAIAEAITWALLLTGMFLKYVTETTELGVRVVGMVHGVVFIAYCLTTVVVAVDQRWSRGRTLLGLVRVGAAVLDRARSTGTPSAAAGSTAPGGWWPRRRDRPIERLVGWLLRNPVGACSPASWPWPR